MKLNHWLPTSILTIALAGCGGGDHSQPQSTLSSPVSVTISPSVVDTFIHQQVQLTATVHNATDPSVSWFVQEAGMGAVSDEGLYTAPWMYGNFHIIAVSNADPTKSARATVRVAASFAFIESLAPVTGPFPTTPMLGNFASNGTLTIKGVTDPQTGGPFAAAIEDITISNDGKKVVFSMEAPGTVNIYIANADFSGITQLTSGAPSNRPQFSPDDKQILYIRWNEPISRSEIWGMNSDGSNQHAVLPATEGILNCDFPTYSPDGKRISAQLLWIVNGVQYYGIAIMNADGSGAIPLTGDANRECGGWDNEPSFTRDGSAILFSRVCDNQQRLVGTLYSINIDGTNLTKLYGDGTWGVVNARPQAVVQGGILFQSNQDFGWCVLFEIYNLSQDVSSGQVKRITNNMLFDGFDYTWYRWFPTPCG